MPVPDTRRVLLIHGLWMHGVSMRWLGARLREAGFEPEEFSYASVNGGPDTAVPRLIDAIGAVPTHLVAHSLGGLMAVNALRAADLPVPRLVCLGTPLCGSAAARSLLGQLPLAAAMLGRSAGLLQGGCAPWTGTTAIGVVAGSTPHGLGQFFARFDGMSDGTVSVAETRLDGLADHVVVPASHSGLLFSQPVARQVVAFLRAGAFAPAEAAAPA